MSVCLLEIDSPNRGTVELWADNYSSEFMWLVNEESENRIDITRTQLREMAEFVLDNV